MSSASQHVQKKYISILGSQLEGFSWGANNVATCRCPECGDSKKNKNKKRFYFFWGDGGFFARCHNCGYSASFEGFLKNRNDILWREYVVEKLKENSILRSFVTPTETPALQFEQTQTRLARQLEIPTITDLAEDHPARVYIANRRIPEKHWHGLFYAENFAEVANTIKEGMYRRDSRIVIPMYDKKHELFAIQGRALNPDSTLRYITIRKTGSTTPKIFGMERLDDTKENFCFEGPFDSLFVENGIAMAGSSAAIQSLPFSIEKTIFVYDNERRNPEMLEQMHQMIRSGLKVCIWPEKIHSKDVNDMVLNGETDDPGQLIRENAHEGLKAELLFSKWSKV